MNEQLKPSLRFNRLRRAAVPMIIVGILGLGGSAVDITIHDAKTDKDANATFSPIESSEQPAKDRKPIVIYESKKWNGYGSIGSGLLLGSGLFLLDYNSSPKKIGVNKESPRPTN